MKVVLARNRFAHLGLLMSLSALLAEIPKRGAGVSSLPPGSRGAGAASDAYETRAFAAGTLEWRGFRRTASP